MKTLYLLRHGHAEPERTTDHDRALTERGRTEAERAFLRLAERGARPDVILASDAVRARQTAECAPCAFSPVPPLELHGSLYLAPATHYVSVLRDHGSGREKVLVVGHNPGLEELVQLMTSVSEHLATATLVELAVPVAAWRDIEGALGRATLRTVTRV